MKHSSGADLGIEVKSSLPRSLHFISGYIVRYVTCCAIENVYTFNISYPLLWNMKYNGMILVLFLKHVKEAMFQIKKRKKKFANVLNPQSIILDEMFNQIIQIN